MEPLPYHEDMQGTFLWPIVALRSLKRQLNPIVFQTGPFFVLDSHTFKIQMTWRFSSVVFMDHKQELNFVHHIQGQWYHVYDRCNVFCLIAQIGSAFKVISLFSNSSRITL